MKYLTVLTAVLISATHLATADNNTDKATVTSVSHGQTQKLLTALRFRQVDAGPLLMNGDYEFPEQIELEPGRHEVRVMCEFTETNGYQILPGMIKFEAKAGKSYQLNGLPSADKKSCEVSLVQ
ncbi:MAG: hypothetical protein R3E90_08085 [Marinicella sp.]|nr:hypothetical protein [Xanthomonadales bacterium]